jgi:hypothetical protein
MREGERKRESDIERGRKKERERERELVRKKDTLHEGPELLLCLNESTKEEAI